MPVNTAVSLHKLFFFLDFEKIQERLKLPES